MKKFELNLVYVTANLKSSWLQFKINTVFGRKKFYTIQLQQTTKIIREKFREKAVKFEIIMSNGARNFSRFQKKLELKYHFIGTFTDIYIYSWSSSSSSTSRCSY